MKKNDYLDLEIKGMTNEGNGVGKAPDGMAVFVPFTAVGDKIYCKIVKAEKSYAYGIVDSVLSPSENRCDNDCEAFYKCGGCSFRHFTYEQELSIKQDFVKASFERIAKLSPKFEEILGCDKVDSYRNKAQLPVASVNGKAVAGFFSKRSHRVMPLSDCKLQPSEFFKIVNEVLCYQNEKGLSCYDETTGKGLLRHIYIRRGEHTGETMLCLVVTKKTSDYDELAELVVSKFPQIVSVVLNINSKNTNVVLGTQCHTIFGKDTITDIMCKNKIEISPLSFYQVNTLQAEKLYEIAGEYAELSENDTLLDLYCGAGTIGLSMASRVKKLRNKKLLDYTLSANIYDIGKEYFVPMYFISGEYDKKCRVELLKKYYDEIVAPNKKLVIMKNCGHSPQIDEPVLFAKEVKKLFKK